MEWLHRAKLVGRALLVPAFCLLVWFVVALAQDSQQDPHVPTRAPIASITPTDPMAR